ncbi:hypothetical protein [Pandoraea sp. NPDC090278]|uniref:hypothetical protein n=1 Tax=Pandoraea sp. NPDC090278 TaxID=3364391 RepID=UPI00383A5F4E
MQLTNTQPEVRKLTIAEIVGMLTGSLVFGTALFSVIGYLFARSYFGELGAPWAAEMLGTPALLVLSAPIITMFVIAGIWGAAIQQTLNDNKAFLIAGVAAAGLFWLVTLTSGIYKGAIASTFFLVVFLVTYGVVVGALAAHAKQRLRQGQPIFSEHIWGHALLAVLTLFIFASSSIGTAVARVHVDPTHSTLAKAYFLEQPDIEWKLVKVVGDKALMLKLTEDMSEREFRVVPMDKIRIAAKPPA